MTLTHQQSDRSFHYRVEVTGLEPGSELPTIEFRRGDEAFATMSAADDPEARLDDSGVFLSGINLDDAELPASEGEFVAE